MNIIKRNGTEVVFDNSKIVAAVEKANTEVPEIERLTKEEIEDITKSVEEECSSMSRTLNVEEIQNLVEDEIMKREHFSVARKYITYRYKRALVRKANTTDDQILSLIECANEEVKQENSNKNPTINSVQRDYMAGEVSKDITKRLLLPEDVVKAHEDGIIHFHDSDYFAQHMHNCCLVNLEDMLQNGTVISETMIEKPKSFSTACNVATQIIAQVASSQYGGQSITLSHLAPFVDISRKKYRKIVAENMKNEGIEVTEEQINSLAEKNVKEEIINYGPAKSMASIHAEVPNNVDIEESHAVIDRIEREAMKKMGLFLVIHMDPVETEDKKVLAIKKDAEEIIKEMDKRVSIHDFRVVGGRDHKNLIFDMVIPYEYDKEKQNDLREEFARRLREKNDRYHAVITMERSYVASAAE